MPKLRAAGSRAARSRLCVLPDGEEHKTLGNVARDLRRAGRRAAQPRRPASLALGGGVVGDIAGFAAACYQRGIDYRAGADDAARAGRLLRRRQDRRQPSGRQEPDRRLPPADRRDRRHRHAATLPPRELRAGLAEVIKYGARRRRRVSSTGSRRIVDELLARDPAALEYAVRRACEIKAQIVAADEREQGRRALLNLGHTFGHAIETGAGYGDWLHGEAVAAGLVLAAELSRAHGLACRAPMCSACANCSQPRGLPVDPPRLGARAHARAHGDGQEGARRADPARAAATASARRSSPPSIRREALASTAARHSGGRA